MAACVTTTLYMYQQSFVGRDFKGWTQMALFILSPYRRDGQKEKRLCILQHLRYICHGGNASERYVICPTFVKHLVIICRCAGALKELYFVPLVQNMVHMYVASPCKSCLDIRPFISQE